MKTNHTPGPWFTCAQVERPHNHALVGIGNGAVHIGYASVTPAMSAGEAQANANLMTAAPDLLKAAQECEVALNIYQQDDINHLTCELVADLIADLRAAIAKAKPVTRASAAMTTLPDHGQGYRLLVNHGIIREGDEIQCGENATWEPVPKASIGSRWNARKHWPVRRKIEPTS